MSSAPGHRWWTLGALLLSLWGALAGGARPACAAPGDAAPGNEAGVPHSPGSDVTALFGEEMQQAATKLKWRGERLTDDCIYAIALTGLSWESAWNGDHLFTLAANETHRPHDKKRSDASYNALVGDVRQAYERRDYGRVLELANLNFSLDEITTDVNLKESVGDSFLQRNAPERALEVFAAPFDASRPGLDVAAADRRFRRAALEAAQKAGLRQRCIAFAFSLLLLPGGDGVDTYALAYLEKAGVDVDRVLLGILQAPEKLKPLAAYYYAAADLLAYRATPRLLPFLLHLANSDDVYLRGRALVGLGIVAYQPRPNDPPGWAARIVSTPLREYGLSASERKLIDREIREAASSDKYRLRAAAALALALVGENDGVPLLQKLSKDKAYVLAPAHDRNGVRRLLFPVRMAASAALARYGIAMEPGGGDLNPKALEMAKRGNQDETGDHRNLRHEIASQIIVSPVDVATAAPMDVQRR